MSPDASQGGEARDNPTQDIPAGRSTAENAIVLILCAITFVTLLSLGNWQLRRLEWKLDLINAVNDRAFQTAVPPPADAISAQTHQYLRVFVEGVFRHGDTKKVKAVTEAGAGYWLLTPLQGDAYTVWVNRGFVTTGIDQSQWSRPEGRQRVEGLLRVTQPGGTLLEKNDPAHQRWYSVDITALSEDVGLRDTASFYVDADHANSALGWPRGGMTIIEFRNTHLLYAVTWYTMALLFLAAMIYRIHQHWRR